MSQTNNPATHPHYAPATPPPNWLTEARQTPPPLLPSLRQVGPTQYVEMNFADVPTLDVLRAFVPRDSSFPFASTRLDGSVSNYGHPFLRDAMEGLILLQRTEWLAKIGRPNLLREFLVAAYTYQGERDVPNPEVPWANDGEKPGRLPHEIWPDWQKSDVARDLHDRLGWSWPTYFGAIDTTPMISMFVAREVQKDPRYLLETFMQTSNRNSSRQTTLLQAYTQGIQHLLSECRVTDLNPEGIYETAPMSNLCWGVWDDSFDAIRTKDGEAPTTRFSPTELQAFTRSALIGFHDVFDGVQRAYEARELSADDFIKIDAMFRRLGIEEDFLAELDATADRLGQYLTDTLVIHDDPVYGSYLARGGYRDEQTNEIKVLDVCTSTPAMVLLVQPEHLPDGIAAVALEQAFDPDKGINVANGMSGISRLDPFHDDAAYHHTNWPHMNALIAEGARMQGAEGRSNEGHEANWLNYIDPFVRGDMEYVRSDGGPRPTPVQEEIRTEVIGSNPHWEYSYVHPAMGSNLEAQWWSFCGRALAQWQLDGAWSGQLPNRATNPTLVDIESRLLAKIEAQRGLHTEALYHREEAGFFADRTQVGTRTIGGVEVEEVVYEGGAVKAEGQRLPGQGSLSRDLGGPSL